MKKHENKHTTKDSHCGCILFYNKNNNIIMNTNFMSLDSNEKVVKETVFTSFLNQDLQNKKTTYKPSDFKNVLHIGYDIAYKDVFKCWDDDENNFTIGFGTKGDEFNK